MSRTSELKPFRRSGVHVDAHLATTQSTWHR
jgi:hypothetical protein